MADPVKVDRFDIPHVLDDRGLREWIGVQRWYASKSRSITGIEIVENVSLRDEPLLLLTLVQTRFATGTHELYQLLLTLEPASRDAEGSDGAAALIAVVDGCAVRDALADPPQATELLRRIGSGGEIETPDGCFSFHCADPEVSVAEDPQVRLMGVEQSNSSLVVDERLVLKVFRKLEPGVNPELEMLRFLTSRQFPNVAPLRGWYEYEGHALSSTLGVAQTFLRDAVGGWELALDEIASAPDTFLDRLGALGGVTAELHNVLASDASDPAFSPEEPSTESLSLLTATVDEDIERIFVRLPDDERVGPILGRGQDVRERLAARSQIGVGGRVIRTHGDYHLGQTLCTPDRWVIIDFEGEPARPLPERRQKRSPLRDVASMLRSFAYVTSAVEILKGRTAPPGFELHARDRFLEQYLATIDATLLPPGESAISNLLSIYELEKAIYELQYELNNRPDWVAIPVAGICRLLETA
jgi:trehalose synthase-fused probable maltokinase